MCGKGRGRSLRPTEIVTPASGHRVTTFSRFTQDTGRHSAPLPTHARGEGSGGAEGSTAMPGSARLRAFQTVALARASKIMGPIGLLRAGKESASRIAAAVARSVAVHPCPAVSIAVRPLG